MFVTVETRLVEEINGLIINEECLTCQNPSYKLDIYVNVMEQTSPRTGAPAKWL